MTDLEITKACAEAMEYDTAEHDGAFMVAVPVDRLKREAAPFPIERTIYSWFRFDPLHDDAQAMALVKRQHIDCLWLPDEGVWVVGVHEEERGYKCSNLNRAICECVAKLQQARKP